MDNIKQYLVLTIGCIIPWTIAINLSAVVSISKIDENRILCKRDLVAQHVQSNHYEKLAAYGIMTSIVGGGIYYMMPQSGGDFVTLSRKNFDALTMAVAKNIFENAQKAPPVVPQSDSNVCVSMFNGLKNTLLSPVKDFVVVSVKFALQSAVSQLLFHHMLAATRIPDYYLKPFKSFGYQLERSVARLYERLFFKPTLQWYITNHTHLKINFKRLYTYAYVIEHRKFPEIVQSINQDDAVDLCESFEKSELQPSQEQIQLYYDKFKMVWTLCVHDIEGIIGFLEFKKNYLPTCADEYEYTIRAVRLIVENFMTMLESRYSNVWKTQNLIPELAQEIKKFTHLLQVECDSCIIAEHAYA